MDFEIDNEYFIYIIEKLIFHLYYFYEKKTL